MHDGAEVGTYVNGSETVEVSIERLQASFSPRRQSCDSRHVAVLAEILQQLPPILVHAPTMRVIDGVHRVAAARSRGEQRIRARLFHGSETEASVHAVQCNIAHGKPLTLAEREDAAMMVLRLHAEWSDRRVADVCGLSPMTVGRLRGLATDQSGQLGARVGRDGKSRPTDPVRVRHRIAHALKTDPGASIRKIAESTGASQATVRDVRTRLENGADILSPRLAKAYQKRQSDGHNGNGQTENGQGDNGQKDAAVELSASLDARFKEWFDGRRLKSDAEWQRWVDSIPIGRVYEVVDAVRSSADVWLRFASALENRARQHRATRRRLSV